ncbi:unnamed protein product [Mytilus edulis]|uniref:Uncharacterized protein n=1 Tax=Mytilus edulis TaxID=6550 RepID=A0A8S3PNY8_MYTED|nr:unnamed protein product [Mytilus edulis]
MAMYPSMMASYNKVYLLMCFLIWIPFGESLEGINVCKRVKLARDAHNRVVHIREFFCCRGYKKENNRCVEITEFYHCPPGYCGEGCLNQCACTINAHCNPVKCCVCNEGFTGQSCDTPCSEGYFGEGCIHTCLCRNHSICDRFTGRCICDDGLTSDACAEAANLNVTCAPNCTCQDARCSNNESHISIPTTIDSLISSEAETSQQTKDVYNVIVILLIVLCLVIIMIAFIAVVIFISTKCKKKYCTVQATSGNITCPLYELS